MTTRVDRRLPGPAAGRPAAPAPRHHVSTLLQVAPLLLEHGIRPRALLDRLELPTTVLLDPEAWLPRRDALRLAHELLRQTADPNCALLVGERNRLEQFGLWGLGILECRTLRSALQFAACNVHWIESGTRLGLDCRGDQAHVTFRFEGALEIDPWPQVEGSLALLRGILRLTGEPIDCETRFAHPARRDPTELERVFGSHLAFGQPANALVFDRAALDLSLHAPPRTAAHRPAPEPAVPCATARSVVRALQQRIEFERPTMLAVADELQMNPRTLQRHLASWGLSFNEVLDDLRHRRAMAYLHDGQLSITDVAFRLGYADAAHFTRAFRRWTGKAPRDVRNGAPMACA